VRITYSLIDPKTHQQVDARTVTGDTSDLFALEDNAVAEVFAMLPQDARSEQPTPSEVHAAEPVAYEYYVRARGYLLDYEKVENIDSAIKQFEQALKLSPNYAPAYAGLGEAYWQGYQAGRGKEWLDKARASCDQALNTDPKLADGHTCLGNIYNQTGKYREAAEEFQRAFSADPKSVNALNGLAEAYDKMGNASPAEETYKKAIALQPQYWAVYNWLGNFYYGQARYADAETQFQKVIALTPDNFQGHFDLGAMYLLEGRYDDAIQTLNRSIELRPTMSAYSNLGAAYFYLHRFPEAITALEKARDLDEQDYLNWGNLGDALYWSLNRRPEADAAYKKAIELAQAEMKVNPKDGGTLACIASFSAMLDEREAAYSQMQRALTLSPKDADVMFRAALVYNHFGQREQTLLWLSKATKAGFSRSTVRDTPDLAQLRQDPAFRDLLKP